MKLSSEFMLNKILKDAHNRTAAYLIELIREDVRNAAQRFLKGAKMSCIHAPVVQDAILGLSGHEKSTRAATGCSHALRRKGPAARTF